MIHTTTDAAEARARATYKRHWQDAHPTAPANINVEAPPWAIAAMLAFATAEAASEAGEREATHDEFATVEDWEYDDQRELSLLYNHRADDSLQFNRGQMRAAMRHGKRLASAANAEGWIVGAADGNRWRTWESGSPSWTDHRENATRYLRREDAEVAHSEDEDAWRVVPFGDESAGEPLRKSMERIADLTERWPNSLVSQVNEIARAALASLPPATAPAMVMVPRLPTVAMLNAAESSMVNSAGIVRAYVAMLAAAPTIPATGEAGQ